MQEPITYFIDQSNGTVDLTLTDERFVAKTQGKGLLDKPRTIDIPISDLKHFCLVPTIAPQNLVSYTSVGDHSYDAEFIFSYREGEQLKKKRVFVNSQDEAFKLLLANLGRECPSASLLHLEPRGSAKTDERTFREKSHLHHYRLTGRCAACDRINCNNLKNTWRLVQQRTDDVEVNLSSHLASKCWLGPCC
jgi:hypothetical protein